jgi:hypothetical protein
MNWRVLRKDDKSPCKSEQRRLKSAFENKSHLIEKSGRASAATRVFTRPVETRMDKNQILHPSKFWHATFPKISLYMIGAMEACSRKIN